MAFNTNFHNLVFINRNVGWPHGISIHRSIAKCLKMSTDSIQRLVLNRFHDDGFIDLELQKMTNLRKSQKCFTMLQNTNTPTRHITLKVLHAINVVLTLSLNRLNSLQMLF